MISQGKTKLEIESLSRRINNKKASLELALTASGQNILADELRESIGELEVEKRMLERKLKRINTRMVVGVQVTTKRKRI